MSAQSRWEAARALAAQHWPHVAGGEGGAPGSLQLTAAQAGLVANAWNGFWSGHFPCNQSTYIRIFKAGNNAVAQNLANSVKHVSTTRRHPPVEGDSPYHYGDMVRTDRASAAGLCSYTFTREPIGHFVSGYNEIEWRLEFEGGSAGKALVNATFVDHPLGSVERVRAFIADVVTFRIFAPRYYELSPLVYEQQLIQSLMHHIFPMSSIFSHVNKQSLAFVGEVEHFERDWERMKGVCGMQGILDRWDSSLGQHPSSADPLGTYRAAKQLLASDCTAYCVIYNMVIADFACFGYQPTRCACKPP